ncbi:MAG: N-acetylmuramoyl-L-alanine amidase [Thiohalomonadales bacterium]
MIKIRVITRPLISLFCLLAIMAALAINSVVFAANSSITSVRHWVGPQRTRLVFESERALDYEVFYLKSPHRVVIDLKQAKLLRTFPQLNLSKSLIKNIRSAKRNKNDLRIVLDVNSPAVAKSLNLKPNRSYRHRLVLDISEQGSKKPVTVKFVAAKTVNSKSVSAKNASKNIRTKTKVKTKTKTKVTARSDNRRSISTRYINKRHPNKKLFSNKRNGVRPVIIAIDAGHGGEDPGAVGKMGSKEKDVVLSISHYLYDLIKKEPGMTPLMVRGGDYFISLRGRMRAARKAKADLFISIHADAAKNARAKGSSVYILSQRSASSVAAGWLAQSQNNSDLIGGVVLDDKDDLLAQVLLNLTQNATRVASSRLAESLKSELHNIGPVHNKRVEKAGFVVLKSPDIPSVLVETGFISNRAQEKQLRTRYYQQKVAKAILKGLNKYFRKNSVPGTLFTQAGRLHKIRSGETLGLLARRYKVSISRLRSINQLPSDSIRVGQTLKIPRVHDG